MSADASLREHLNELHHQEHNLLGLLLRPCVLGISLFVETSLIADAYGAAVEGAAVSTHLEQTAVLRNAPVAADVEMIADGAESARLVVAQERLHGIVPVAWRSRAVEHDVPHTFCRHHRHSILHLREQGSLVEHLLSANGDWKHILYHGSDVMRVEQLLTPSAVSAAMTA